MKKFICMMLPFALFLLNPLDMSAQDKGKSQEKKESQKGQASSEDVLRAKGAPGMAMELDLEQLRTELLLSDEQFNQIQQIQETNQVQRVQLETREYPTEEARQNAQKSLWKAQINEIKQVLNEEQKVKFKAMLDKQHKTKKENPQGQPEEQN